MGKATVIIIVIIEQFLQRLRPFTAKSRYRHSYSAFDLTRKAMWRALCSKPLIYSLDVVIMGNRSVVPLLARLDFLRKQNNRIRNAESFSLPNS